MPCERVDGRTDGGWGFHTPPSSHPHPSMRRIQRPGTRPQAGDYLSLSFFFLLFVGSAASPTFLSLPPKNAATPSHFLPRLHLPSRYIRARRTRSEGDKAASGAGLPPVSLPFLAPDRRRSGPTARGGRRSKPGRRAASVRFSPPASSCSWPFSSCCLPGVGFG